MGERRRGWLGWVACWAALAVVIAFLGSWVVFTFWGEPRTPGAGLDAGSCSPAKEITTLFSATVALGTIDLSVDATLPPRDPSVTSLLSGTTSLPSFVDDLLGGLSLNGVGVWRDFRGAAACVSTTSAGTRVLALAHRLGETPVGTGQLSARTSRAPGASYTFQLAVRDYTVLSYDPLPDTLLKGVATWNVGASGLPWTLTVAHQYDPLAHPLAVLRRSPLELVSTPLSLVPQLVSALVLAIPTVWTLGLLRPRCRLAPGEALQRFDARFRRLLRGLLALSLAGSVAHASSAAGAGSAAARPLALAVPALVAVVGGGLALGLGLGPQAGAKARTIGARAANARGETAAEAEEAVETSEASSDHGGHNQGQGGQGQDGGHGRGGPGTVIAAGSAAFRGLALGSDLTRSVAYAGLIALAVAAVNPVTPLLPPLPLPPLPPWWDSYTVPAAVAGACLLGPLFAWAWLLYTARNAETKPRRWQSVAALGVLIPWALLAIPAGADVLELDPAKVVTAGLAYSDVLMLLGLLPTLYLPLYLVAMGTILRLRLQRTLPQHATLWGWAGLLFAGVVVGTHPNIFLAPVPFVIALFLLPRFVLLREDEQAAIDGVAGDVRANRPALLHRTLVSVPTGSLSQAMPSLARKLIAGDLTIAEYQTRTEEIVAYLAAQEQADQLPKGVRLSDVLIGLGPEPSHWENGARALVTGLVVAVPLLLPSLAGYLASGIGQERPYFPLSLADQLVAVLGYWLVGAFLFGYYLPYIRGESGLTKGLRLSIAAVFCLLPAWLLPSAGLADVVAVLLRAGQTVLFFAVLGGWAFDYRTFRNTLRTGFTWNQFARFGGLANVTAASSVLLASAGLGVGTVLSGQVTAILSSVIHLAFPQVPTSTTGP